MLDDEDKKKRTSSKDAEEVREILGVVTTEIPALIRNLVASVFSEESGRSMGKAAAAFYTQLKDSGIPEQQALEMTQDYMKAFTGLGDLFKQIGREPAFSQKINIRSSEREEEES